MTVTKRGPRGPYAKTALRRAGIVDAALALVIEKGHRDVTTTEIAERAGVTESTLLYHFPTKDHLLVAVLAESEERDRQREAALAASGHVGREAGLAASEQSGREGRARPGDQEWNAEVIGRQAELNVAHAETLRLFVRMAAEATEPSHPAHDWFLAHHRAAYAEFADALRRMQDAGQAHPDVDPERFAWLAAKAMAPREKPEISLAHLHASTVSVREQASVVVRKLRGAGTATFRALVADAEERLVVVARFLALLDLARKHAVAFEQLEALGELTIRWTGGDADDVAVTDEFDAPPTPEPASGNEERP